MAIGGGTTGNNLDVAIITRFDPTGVNQAKTAIGALNRTVSSLQNTAKNLNKVTEGLAGGMNNVSKSTRNTSRDMFSATREATNIAERYTRMAQNARAVANNVTYMGQTLKTNSREALAMASAIGQSTAATQRMATAMVSGGGQSASAMSRLGTTVRSGVTSMIGHFGSLIERTISVGDVFGFYIGTVALQAIYDMTIGIARLKEDAISVLKFVGMSSSEVAGVVAHVSKLTVKMPRVQIPEMLDTFKKVRMSVSMTSDQMKKFTPVIGDIITLFKANGQTAQKAALAIEDIASGGANAARRLQEIGLTSKILRKFGFDVSTDAGNVEKLFTAFEKLFSSRGVGGIAMKLDTVSDAWDYLNELIAYTGMTISEGALPVIKDFLLLVGKIVTVTPAPIIALGFAFAGLTALILVAMPLLASVIGSVETLGFAFLPLTRRIKDAAFNLNSFQKIAGLTKKELKALDSLSKKQFKAYLPEMRRVKEPTAEPGKTRYVYYEVKADDKDLKKLTKSTRDFNKEMDEWKKKHVVIFAGQKTLKKNIDDVTDSTKKSSGGIRNWISSTKAAGGIGGFLLGPLGILLMIVGVIVALITATNSWGRISKVLGEVWNTVISILEPAVAVLADIIEQAWDGVQAWSGWKDIANFIKGAKDEIQKLVDYVNQNLPKTGKAAGETSRNVASAGFSFFDLGDGLLYGADSGQTFYDRLVILTGGLLALVNPVTMIMALWTSFIDLFVNTPKDLLSIDTANLNEITAYNDALYELQAAWQIFWDSVDEIVKIIKPALDDLGRAWDSLMVALFGPEYKKGSDETKSKTKETQKGFHGLRITVQVLVNGMKVLAWFLTNVVVPVFQAVGFIIWGFAKVFTFVINAVQGVVVSLKLFWAVLTQMNILGVVAAWIGIIVGMLQLLYHWIMGESPGVIPAIKLFLAIVRGAFPAIRSIITSAVSAAISIISRFVSNTVSWFRSLPGKIYSALSGIKTEIVKQLQNAYNGAVSWLGNFVKIGTMIKDKVVAGIKSALGIRSPSKVTAGLGAQISQGLFEGMKKWVVANATKFMEPIKKNAQAGLKILADSFMSFKWINYMGLVQGTSKTLNTMTGNCYDAAAAFIQLANSMGWGAEMYRTFVGTTPHRVVNLPKLGAWIDPSGILGRGIQKGRAPGSPAGAPVEVYQYNPTVKDEIDLNKLGVAVGQQVINALRFGI